MLGVHGGEGGSDPQTCNSEQKHSNLKLIREKNIKKLVCCFCLLVLFEGEIKYYLQGNWTVCVPLKYRRSQMFSIYSSNFAPPPPRVGIFCASRIFGPHPDLFLCTPLRSRCWKKKIGIKGSLLESDIYYNTFIMIIKDSLLATDFKKQLNRYEG